MYSWYNTNNVHKNTCNVQISIKLSIFTKCRYKNLLNETFWITLHPVISDVSKSYFSWQCIQFSVSLTKQIWINYISTSVKKCDCWWKLPLLSHTILIERSMIGLKVIISVEIAVPDNTDKNIFNGTEQNNKRLYRKLN